MQSILEKVRSDTGRDNKGLIAALYEALLFNGYELEHYDEQVFSVYVNTPIFRHPRFKTQFWSGVSNQSSNWKDFIRYRPVNIPQPDLSTVFDAYLNHMTNKALAGGSLEEYKTHLGEHAATTLENKKNLQIVRRNKRTFRGKEDVKLILDVKNVPELTIKIFEIDTETYYKKNNAEINDAIDLDGLIPEKLSKLQYSHKKHHQHTEEFVFDELSQKEKGVFIVEFIGNGISSRALIKKGSLDLLVQEHFQGFQLYIIDEDKKICHGQKTGIFIESKFHRLNEKGFVLLPFGEAPINSAAILSHDGFNCLSRIALGTENYSLSTAVVFNEESIISGRKLRIILKNKLLLNGTPITLRKFEEFNAEVQLTNYEGITNYKHFKDIKLSDAEDHVLELIVPPMLTTLQVKVNGKLKTLINKDVFLNNAETIKITRDEGSTRFITAHLNHDEQGYLVELRGKNGEHIPNRQVIVQFFKTFGNFNFTKELFTDAVGRVRIGHLEEIKWIQVKSNTAAFNPRSFVLPNQARTVSISDVYNICVGDELVLPSMGLALTRNHFELLRNSTQDNSVISDCFDAITLESGSDLVVLKGLEKGLYTFNYSINPRQSLRVVVHEAQRWEANPLFLELPNAILDLKAEAKYLCVSTASKQGDKLTFRVSSNSLQNVRIHALAYYHHSHLLPILEQKSNSICPRFSERQTNITRKYNNYRSNRVLSDEHVYVNERKNKTAFIGNTLNKPSILLHREKVRETKDDEEMLRGGADFAADQFVEREEKRSMMNMAYSRERPSPTSSAALLPTSYTVISNLDFLEDSGRTFPNIRPNEEGLVEIPLAELAGYSYVLINVSDNSSNLFYDVPLAAATPKQIDLRVPKAKEQGLIYSEDFFTVTPTKTAPGKIEDMANTSNYMVEDLSSALDLLLVIAGSAVNKTEIQKWKFLVSWNKLSDEEKFKKFEEFGGHELNVFAYIRDRSFFDAHIKPILRFKAKKDLIDRILLDEDALFANKLRAENFNKLNMLEGALLVHKLKDSRPELCKDFLESLRKRQEVKLDSSEKKKALYESILASKKIEEEVPKRVEIKAQFQPAMRSAPQPMMASMPMQYSAAPKMAMKRMAMRESVEREMVVESRAMMMMSDDMDMLDMPSAAPEPMKIEKYQKKGAAFEFKERQEYFKGQFDGLVLNKFWVKVVENILTQGTPLILGEEIINMNTSSLEVVLAVTFTDLHFERGTMDTKVEGTTLHITSTENLLIFCKRMEERKTDTLNMELVISQKFYDPEEKFAYDEKDPSIYTIKEVKEYLTAKVYEARIAFTNVGESSCNIKLASMTTQVVTFSFYFPSVGTFKYYPATIMKNNRFVASAKYMGDLNVVAEYSKDNKVLETLQDILNYGTIDDILNFMAQKNIFNDKIFTMDKVRWIFKSSPEHFKKAIAILKQRYFYDRAAWGYSIYHGCTEEFLDLLRVVIPDLVSEVQYVKIHDDIVVDRFEPLEYDPLINPRAHDISDKKHNILNKTFKETYERFLKYCVERGQLGQREKVILTAYLVLQDRIQDALQKIKEIDEKAVLQDGTMTVQFEYLKAYLSIYTDHPKYDIARNIAAKYHNFPDLSWRKRFREISKQIAEHDKGMVEKTEEEKKTGVQDKTNKELADRSEYLSLELKENFQLAITHKNVSRLTISFYKLEMEILFSNDPFLEKDIMNFVSVNPNHLLKFKIAKSSEFKTNTVQIPENLQKDSLFIQVKAKDKFEIVKSFNSHLRVHTIEDFGLLNVTDLKGKCLNSVYVKCFSKKRDGTVKFYKDGYTDFRGSFDFASLNSDSLNDIEKFGLFVYSNEHGSVILTAKPPSQVGRIVKDEEESPEAVQEEVDDEFEDAPVLE